MTVPAVLGSSAMADLEKQGVVTRRALFLPNEVSESEFVALAVMFTDEQDKTRFLLGDLLVASKSRYGDDFTVQEVMAATNLTLRTLTNYESVMLRVRPDARHHGLPFGHHDVVQALEPSEQKRLLNVAFENGWSRQRLRDEVYGEKVLPPTVSDDLPAVVRDALDGARQYGDGWLISRDSYQRLKAALGDDG